VTLRGLIFDLDGTLADTIPVCCAAFRDVMETYLGRRYSDAEIVALFGPSEEGIIRGLAGDRWQECLRAYYAAYEREHAACADPFPGVRELLAALDERAVPVAIVTGKGATSAAISLRRLGLDRHFDIVATGSPEGSAKTAAIGRIVRFWVIPPATVGYVGDAPYDIDEARAAGVLPLAAAWARTADAPALRVRRPHALFTSVDQLIDWIARHTDA
jgi:phosphoglycolate phosphatase-like HAD superfamily hydrolase